MLMNDYLKAALVEWGCSLEIGLASHGGDFDLLLLSLRKLSDPYRLNDLKLTQSPDLIEMLYQESLVCGAFPLCDVLIELKSEWNEDLFEVLMIEMSQLQKIL